jgi:hypothetical protein
MGRAITASQVINFGTMPLAAAVAGVLGEHIGLRPTIALMATIHLGACLAILRTPLARLHHLPEPTYSPNELGSSGVHESKTHSPSKLPSPRPGKSKT